MSWTSRGVVPDPQAQFVATVERVPRVARWVLPVTALLRRGTTDSTLDQRLRSLVALRMAALDGAAYWADQQRSIAADLGISSDEVGAIVDGTWRELSSLSEREQAALQWTDRVAVNEAKRDKPAFAALEDQFDRAEIVELTALAGMCALLDRFSNALGLEAESSATVDVATGVEPTELAHWAATMFEEGGGD